MKGKYPKSRTAGPALAMVGGGCVEGGATGSKNASQIETYFAKMCINLRCLYLIQSLNLYFSFIACAIISGLFDGENPNSAAKKSYAKLEAKER